MAITFLKSQFLTHRVLILRYIFYNGAGLICTAIYLAVNVLFVQIFHLTAVLSVMLGFFIYIALNYVLNGFWVFRLQMQKAKHTHAAVKFIIVSMLGLVLNISIMYLTVNILKLYYVYGLIFAICIIPTVNFIMHNLWSFKSANAS
jgi:putative flippase GtrA